MLANRGAGHAPNSPLNGRMPKPHRAFVHPPQRASDHDQLCLRASAVDTVKSRPRRGAKAGHPKIAEALHALVAKKRLVRVVVKKRMASLQRHRVDVPLMATAHRAGVLAPVPEAATPGVATRAAAQDLAIRVQALVRGELGLRVALHAAVAATVATRPLVAQAMAVVAVTTATVAAAVAVRAMPVVAVATTGAAQVAVKVVATVVATKAGQVQAHRVRAGVIAASHRRDAAVAARARVMAVATVAARAATEIAAALAAVDSQVIVARHQQVAASALAAAQVIVTA